MQSGTKLMSQHPSAAMINGYQQTQKTVANNREFTVAETDAIVLHQAADRLKKAQQSPEDDFFEESLLYNQLIWTVIQSEMAAENPLPEEIKANFISLSIFIDKQTAKAIGNRDADLLNALIEINRNIALGLEKQPPEQSVT